MHKVTSEGAEPRHRGDGGVKPLTAHQRSALHLAARKGGYALIPVMRRKDVVALAKVDLADAEVVSQFRWGLTSRTNQRPSKILYARTSWQYCHFRMHHLIVGQPLRGFVTDHINGDAMDNRRANLRIVTNQANTTNRGPCRGTRSGIRGVSWDARDGKWRVVVVVHDRHYNLGYFADKREAGRVASEFRAKHMPYSSDARLAA